MRVPDILKIHTDGVKLLRGKDELLRLGGEV